MAKTQQRVIPGRCPNHGIVEGTKELPTLSFPFIVYGVRRGLAAMAPVECPQCGSKLGRV